MAHTDFTTENQTHPDAWPAHLDCDGVFERCFCRGGTTGFEHLDEDLTRARPSRGLCNLSASGEPDARHCTAALQSRPVTVHVSIAPQDGLRGCYLACAACALFLALTI